jgi:hypothetical protein
MMDDVWKEEGEQSLGGGGDDACGAQRAMAMVIEEWSGHAGWNARLPQRPRSLTQMGPMCRRAHTYSWGRRDRKCIHGAPVSPPLSRLPRLIASSRSGSSTAADARGSRQSFDCSRVCWCSPPLIRSASVSSNPSSGDQAGRDAPIGGRDERLSWGVGLDRARPHAHPSAVHGARRRPSTPHTLPYYPPHCTAPFRDFSSDPTVFREGCPPLT